MTRPITTLVALVFNLVTSRVDPLKLDVVAWAVLDDDSRFAVTYFDVGRLNARPIFDDYANIAIWKREFWASL